MSVEPRDMPVVILAGGMGTRIREVSERIPKPMVEIGEQPILWHIMKLYGHHGFRRFVLCLGYKSAAIKQYFLSYREQFADFTLELSGDHDLTWRNNASDEDWEVTCVETGLLTGTGGRLGRVQDYIDADTFMFTYGDGIGEVDVSALLDHHRRLGRIATLTGVRPTSRYGEMHVDGDRVVEFNEKPTVSDGFVSGGFFVLDRGVFDYVDGSQDLFFEKQPLQRLARDGQLSVFPHDGFWLGMDTFRDYQLLNDLWNRGEAPWKVWRD